MEQILNDWNPWWAENSVRPELRGVSRELTGILENSLEQREIVVLNGGRRTGKTTLMYQLADYLLENGLSPKQVFYINLDDESLMKSSLEEIYLTYRRSKNPRRKAYMFIDEVQQLENWERWLKKMYDKREDVKFIVSGSNASLLKQDFSKLLTGRTLQFDVMPLSFKEYLKFKGMESDPGKMDSGTKNLVLGALEEFMSFGGYPETVKKDDYYRKRTLKDYFDSIVYRDIIARFDVDEKQFLGFVLYMMENSGNPFSYRSLGKALELNYITLMRYLQLAENAYLGKELEYFSFSLKKQSKNDKKFYVLDNGLRNAVSQGFSPDYGRAAENLVFSELLRRDETLFYWKGRNEVDFVAKGDELYAINVSYTDNPGEREFKGLLEIAEEKKVDKLLLLTRDTKGEKEGIKMLPLWEWLLD
jgi:hypothetical protein